MWKIFTKLPQFKFSTHKTYYEILEISQSASPELIKNSYLKQGNFCKNMDSQKISSR